MVHRKRNSFTLKSLLVITSLLAVWAAVVSSRARKQRDAIDRVATLGGRIIYQHELDADGATGAKRITSGPNWLRDRLGPEFFDVVHSVSLRNADVLDDDLEVLAGLHGLRELSLLRTPVTDEGIRHLVALRRLENLTLDGTQATDKSVDALLDLPSLKSVGLVGTGVSRSGVERLLQAGLKVWYVQQCDIEAAAPPDGDRHVLLPGQQIPVSGELRVPKGASIGGSACIVHLVCYRSGARPLIMQAASAKLQRVSEEVYSFSTVLHLKGAPSRRSPGALIVRHRGIDLDGSTDVVLLPTAATR